MDVRLILNAKPSTVITWIMFMNAGFALGFLLRGDYLFAATNVVWALTAFLVRRTNLRWEEDQ